MEDNTETYDPTEYISDWEIIEDMEAEEADAYNSSMYSQDINYIDSGL